MFTIGEWVGAKLDRDPDAMAWLGEMAHPSTVVGPVELVAEGLVSLHTIPPAVASAGGVPRVFRWGPCSDDPEGPGYVVTGHGLGWITRRRECRSTLPIPVGVQAILR